MSGSDLELRIVELELRFMEQQAVIEVLDAVVRDQATEIDALRKELGHLQAALADQGEALESWDE